MSSRSVFITEYDFTLPRGLVDETGVVHRQGIIRLATAKDELMTQKDQRVKNDPAYSTLVMLAQVITSLGSLTTITPEILENLFTQDLAYLRELYNRINQQDSSSQPVQCPECSYQFEVEFALSGESSATP
ncbi:MAG: phage tail assembly protein [Microcoleus sp. SIO2G3]|nr:phage tail assembly protein [Microcoleus sp. SIO2G3]